MPKVKKKMPKRPAKKKANVFSAIGAGKKIKRKKASRKATMKKLFGK